MIIVITLISSAVTFFAGYLLGTNYASPEKVHTARKKYTVTETTLDKEYRNFLNYDGNEQS